MGKYQVIKNSQDITTQSSPSTDEWFTPLGILALVQQFYADKQWLDVASCELAQEYVKAPLGFFSKENSALDGSWEADAIWMNPPYSQALVSHFAKRFLWAYHGAPYLGFEPVIKEGLVLVNSSTETNWFQMLAQSASIRLDIRGRLKFWHPERQSKNRATQGQTIFYFGNRTKEFMSTFNYLGLFYSKPVGGLFPDLLEFPNTLTPGANIYPHGLIPLQCYFPEKRWI